MSAANLSAVIPPSFGAKKAFKQLISPLQLDLVCDYCPRKICFQNKAQLLEHKAGCEFRRPFCCPVCPLRFTTRTALRDHGLTHSGESRYECQICGMRQKTQSGHKRHLKIHKLLNCQFCNRNFSRKTQLSIHMREVHAGKVPLFHCDKCGKGFMTNYTLKKHSCKPIPSFGPAIQCDSDDDSEDEEEGASPVPEDGLKVEEEEDSSGHVVFRKENLEEEELSDEEMSFEHQEGVSPVPEDVLKEEEDEDCSGYVVFREEKFEEEELSDQEMSFEDKIPELDFFGAVEDGIKAEDLMRAS